MRCEHPIAAGHISVTVNLRQQRREYGSVYSRGMDEGYARGAAEHLRQALGAAAAYEIVQRIADELAEYAVNQQAEG